jgi:capsular exopolysaccharide synthesis family protein
MYLRKEKTLEQTISKIIRRWLWFLVLAVIFAGAVAYVSSMNSINMYEAKVRLLIGPGINSPNPDVTALRAGGQLMQTYAELAVTGPFLQSLIDELNLGISPEELGRKIEVKSNQETQILSIRVLDPDANRAIEIANAAAQALVRLSPSGEEGSATQLENQMSTQARNIEQTIANTETRINDLEAQLKELGGEEASAAKGNQASQELSDAEARLDKYEADLQVATDGKNQSLINEEILLNLITSSSVRIEQFRADHNTTSDVKIQLLLMDQITQEINHLSEVQKVLLETRRLFIGLPLDEFIANTEASIAQLQVEFQNTRSSDEQRLLLERITQEESRLTEAQRTADERKGMILDQVSKERSRLSSTEQVQVQKQQIIIDQLTVERTRLSDARQSLALLYDLLQKTPTNQVKIVEPATTSQQLVSQTRLKVLIGGIAGLILALVIVLGVEFLDDTVKSAEDIMATSGVPLLGSISRHKALKGSGYERLIVQAQPESPAAESYRQLSANFIPLIKVKGGNGQTNHEHPDSQISRPGLPNGSHALKSILITSPEVIDNFDAVPANLGVVLAQTGPKVILVDANLHLPSITHLLDLNNRKGLSDLLTGSIKSFNKNILVEWSPSLTVLPAGPILTNPFELLVSNKMADLINQLENLADVVLILAPPFLSYAESHMLASRVDGVLIVAQKGQTRRKTLVETAEKLQSLNARLIGAILDQNRSARLSLQFRRRGLEAFEKLASLKTRIQGSPNDPTASANQ